MIALFSLLLVLLPGWARAAPSQVTVCVDVPTDYYDADLGLPSSEDGDYLTNNFSLVARGALVRVVNLATSSYIQKFANWEGATPGCAGPFNLDSDNVYAVRLVSTAQVAGNLLQVRRSVADPVPYLATLKTGWSPPPGSSTQFGQPSTPHEAWNVLAAATFAQYRVPGVTGATFTLFVEYDAVGDPCSGGGSCHRDGLVHLSSTGVDRRFIIAHELGHAVAWAAGGQGPSDYDAPVNACYTDADRSHEMASKEYQSAAIKEGWAHYYAAAAFNRMDEADCGFVYYKSQDYDLDEDKEREAPSLHGLSCETGPGSLFGSSPPIPALDYLGTYCMAGAVADRATELDWLRFWWNLTTDQGVPFQENLNILATAVLGAHLAIWPGPGPWDDVVDASTPVHDEPSVRMREAADYLGWDTEWNALDNAHGVHR